MIYYQNLFNRVYWGLLTYISKNFIKGNFEDCKEVLIGVMEKVWTKIEYILWRIVWKFHSKHVNLPLNYDENQLKLRQI